MTQQPYLSQQQATTTLIIGAPESFGYLMPQRQQDQYRKDTGIRTRLLAESVGIPVEDQRDLMQKIHNYD